MMRAVLALTMGFTLGTGAVFAQDDDLRSAIAADYEANLESLYQHFHANPELAFEEHETAARLAQELRALGYEVTEGVGRTGLVAVLENGDGPTVMLRADMDALPIREQTGLAFASTALAQTPGGQELPVMHACAHDTHMTALVGTARQMMDRRDDWSGTLVLIGQPAEEVGFGSDAMLQDGLYERFPVPDAVVSFHTWGYLPAGQIRYVPEYAMANVDTVDLYIKGVGAHGASPHLGKDPIVLGANIVTALQTLVSRELSPFDVGVVTVGAFNAGTKHNIISDEAHLQLTVRSYTDAVREKLITGIERIARGQAQTAGLSEDLMPVMEVKEIYTPALYNDPVLTQQAGDVLRARFGDRVQEADPVTGGEDFARFGRTEHDVPIFMFWVGASPQDVIDQAHALGETPPSNHSPFFYPDADIAIPVAVEGMTTIAMDVFENGVGE